MPDNKRFFSEPDPDLDGTQPVEVDATRHLPPPPGRSHVQLPSRPQQSRKRDKRKRAERTSAPNDPRKSAELKRADRPRERSKSGLYLPAWSVLLMLGTVFVVAFGIIALVIALGGGAEPGGSPRIIITAVPSDTPLAPVTEPTSGGIVLPNQNTGDLAVPDFPLEGPTLPPIVLSPTPLSIVVGSTVVVNAEGGLNVRSDAGLDNSVICNADNGSTFTIADGPMQANGLTWWQVRDTSDPNCFGWAAADYLDVQES